MRIVFFSNFLNHHQLPLCNAIIAQIGAENFKFVATMRITQERINAGYQDMNQLYPFVLKEYEGGENKKVAEQLAVECDMMIFGAAPFCYQDLRLKNGKIVFHYCERPFKHGKWSLLIPQITKRTYNHFIKHKRDKLYVLCAGAYVENDLSFIGFDTNKCFKWGYFPEVKRYENIETILSKKNKNSMLWVARLIKLKHPEHVIELASRLKKGKFQFTINIIGNGPLYDSLKKSVLKKGLEGYVNILGLKTNDEVRHYMEESEIFLFTSNRLEGWGAVLNEAMNSGCVPVSGNLIGATPYLVKDEVNGRAYKTGSVDDLYEKVSGLLDNHDSLKEMGLAAYHTMADLWNAENAVMSLLKLNNSIINNQDNPINDGPCSYAGHYNEY